MRDRETSTSPTAKILVMTLELDAQHHDGVDRIEHLVERMMDGDSPAA